MIRLYLNNIYQYTSDTPKYEKVLKECSKYKKGFDDGTGCPTLTSSNTNKKCSYDSSKDECSEMARGIFSLNAINRA